MTDDSYEGDVVEFLNFCELRGVSISEECRDAWELTMKAAGVDEAVLRRRMSVATRMLSKLRGVEDNE